MQEVSNEEKKALVFEPFRCAGVNVSKKPEKLIVDNSTLQCFKDCPFKCYLRYRKHLVLKDDATRFKPEFGSAIHEGMASWYKKKNAEEMDSAFIKYWQKYDGQDNTGLRTMERGLVALENYRKQFLDEPITADPELIEIGGSIDIGPFIFCFRLDGVVKWLDWEGHYVMEHKTSARKNSICVKPNAQIEGYAYGAAAVTGLKISGALFNFFHFRKGRKGEDVKNTIELTRQMVDIDDKAIKMWKEDFLYWATKFSLAIECKVWPRNTGMCFTYGRCPYLPVCEMGGNLSNVSSLYKEEEWKPFPEVKG